MARTGPGEGRAGSVPEEHDRMEHPPADLRLMPKPVMRPIHVVTIGTFYVSINTDYVASSVSSLLQTKNVLTKRVSPAEPAHFRETFPFKLPEVHTTHGLPGEASSTPDVSRSSCLSAPITDRRKA